MAEIDARGLSCPAPVLLAKEVIDKEQPSQVLVLVDSEAARKNYDLIKTKQCGQTTNMLDIVTAMQLADKVITFG